MTATLRETVEEFLYLEARLADEHRYDEWEALWCDDGVYWVPAGEDDPDPDRTLSYVYDSRRRLATRIGQLKTGRHFAQAPPSRLRRLISNIEVAPDESPGLVVVSSNFLLVENRDERTHLWAGRTVHHLRRTATQAGLGIVLKKVLLVDNDAALPTLAFLI